MPGLRNVLGAMPVDLHHWFQLLGIALLILLVMEAHKELRTWLERR